MQTDQPTDALESGLAHPAMVADGGVGSIEVELTHPFIGSTRVLAQELDDSGLLIDLPAAVKGFKPGTNVKVSPCHCPLVESKPAPVSYTHLTLPTIYSV